MPYKLSNGIEIPLVSFGTFNIGEELKVTEIVKKSLKSGYRHIDTASIYKNEEAIGKALKDLAGQIPRKEIIISGKVWNKDQGYDSTIAAFESSCKKLEINYLDIYLIHWPVPYGHEKDYQELNYQTWMAMSDLYCSGKIKAIGVSNFLPHQLTSLMEKVSIKPMINQIEINPCYHQKENLEFCQRNNIMVQAWSPFKRGDVFSIPELKKIAQKYNTSISRVCLQWCLQLGIQPIPKASSEDKMRENLPPYEFVLEKEDFEIIASLNDKNNHALFGDYELQKNN